VNRRPILLPLILALLPVPLLTGCGGPVLTPGTQGLPRDQLATVHVKQHGGIHEWQGQAVHVDKFLVGGVAYPVSGDRDFLVSPGQHTFTVDYGPCIHDLRHLGNPTEATLTGGPYGNFKATVEPGAQYELTAEEKLTGANAVQMVHGLKRVNSPAK
jgi:hypothetical protein